MTRAPTFISEDALCVVRQARTRQTRRFRGENGKERGTFLLFSRLDNKLTPSAQMHRRASGGQR